MKSLGGKREKEGGGGFAVGGAHTPAEFRSDGPTIECDPIYTYLGNLRVLLLPWPVLIYQLLDIKCVSKLYSTLVFLLPVRYLLLY